MEDDAYHEWVDRVITSEDFITCEHKDKESNCLLSRSKERCWHLMTCPKNYKRR